MRPDVWCERVGGGSGGRGRAPCRLNNRRATFRPELRPLLLHGSHPCRSARDRPPVEDRSLASERSVPLDGTSHFALANGTPRRPHRGDRSMYASQARCSWHLAVARSSDPRPTNACRYRDADENFFGIIFRTIRLRNSIRTTAVKSPEPMRDVARIRCDHPRVIKVDDPVGT